MPDTTDPMEAAVQAVVASEQLAPENESPDPAEQEEPEFEEEPVDDAETDDDPASEDEAEEEEAPEEPTLYTVKADGKEHQVTLEELTRHYSAEKSAARRVEEAEAIKREATAYAREAETIFGALQAEVQQVQAFRQHIEAQGYVPPPKAPDPRLAEQNPAAYVKARAKFDADVGVYQQQQARFQALEARQAQLTQAAQQAYLADQLRAVAEHIPEFAQPETARAAQERLVRAAETYGYTADEVGAVMDARAVRVLHDAAKYREIQARKQEVAKPKPPTHAPRHVPPAAARRPDPMSEERKAILALRKTGSVQDAVRVLMARETS